MDEPPIKHPTPAQGDAAPSSRRATAPWVDPTVIAAGELLVVAGSDAGRRYPIFGGEIIGRGDDADIQLDVEEISRRHCALHRVGGAFPRLGAALEIEDLGSRNGTWIRGERVANRRRLPFGERITLGSSVGLVLAQNERRSDDDDPAERFEAIARLVGGAATALDDALATTLAAIDELRQTPGSTPLSDAAVSETLGNLIGSIHHQLEIAHDLHHLGTRDVQRSGRVEIGRLCAEVARGLSRDNQGRVEIEEHLSRTEVRGDLVELFSLIQGAAEHLLRALPEGGALEIRCRADASSKFDGRPRHAIIEIERSAVDAVVPLARCALPDALSRRASLHGGRIAPLPGDAIGCSIQLPLIARARAAATRDAARSLADD